MYLDSSACIGGILEVDNTTSFQTRVGSIAPFFALELPHRGVVAIISREVSRFWIDIDTIVQ